MEDKKSLDQLELILAELIHSNELSEKKIVQNDQRIVALEKFYVIVSIMLVLVGGGTLFAVLKLLGVY